MEQRNEEQAEQPVDQLVNSELPEEFADQNRRFTINELVVRNVFRYESASVWDPYLESVLSRLPADVVAKLEEEIAVIVAPPAVRGMEIELTEPIDRIGHWVYLCPSILRDPVSEIEFTIAHELAHVILDHEHSSLASADLEHEADRLATDWGFSSTRSLCQPNPKSPTAVVK